jgi:hypothetical protein
VKGQGTVVLAVEYFDVYVLINLTSWEFFPSPLRSDRLCDPLSFLSNSTGFSSPGAKGSGA